MIDLIASLEVSLFIPKSFAETDMHIIRDFVATHPLATVIVQTPQGLEASHIPLYWQPKSEQFDSNVDTASDYLMGHIGKINPLNDELLLDKPWLIIFQEAGHYISPNWYPSKAVTHKEVPTWNYRSVHMTANASLLTQPEQVKAILSHQTAEFEAAQPVPWSLEDAPDRYIQGLSRAIVGVKLKVIDIKAQFKLSQNKSVDNRVRVVTELRNLANPAATAMAELINIDNLPDESRCKK